ncbi:MAG: CBS domain-containing protein [Pseudomonadales bacterium]|jgi:magnesium and cobalt transporter|nr:CBS domain-containing protein [Pseudomonadales bacterium]MDP4639993.1 CBS domain-containing protein [Pseudomonadales bacterium]MDP4765343.1 CBS domain-containing protein [Pseudomonadales bacterium]MDP4874545.1 CBS domain-containing protein [Pseudomonadales bacterium]MDP4910520.1 CBS domain-containing protein [Pseudomonadales bacterium]
MSEEGSSNEKSWLERLSMAFTGEPSSREELVELLRSAQQRDLLDAEVLSIIEGALMVSDMQAREIMIPRSQVAVVRLDMKTEELLPLVIESGHSRFPVLGDGPDDVVGILLAKDLLPLALADRRQKFNLRDILRSCTAIPESKRLNVLLQEFRATRNHLAVVYDEYGGVSGIVTIEDVLEQIVGDIEDEFDFNDEDFIKAHANGVYTVKALTPIEDFNGFFGSSFSEDEFDTIGGIVTQSFGHLPKRDERVTLAGFQFKVLNADNRRIKLLQLKLLEK